MIWLVRLTCSSVGRLEVCEDTQVIEVLRLKCGSIKMRKQVVMGVDLGLRHLISTSAYYGFGDEMMLFTIRDSFNEAENWIAEQICRGSAWLCDWAKEKEANIIALEDLKIGRLDVSKNEKMVLEALMNKIKEDSSECGLKVVFVSPLYSSQQCSNCGRRGYRDGIMFFCPYCNYGNCADVNAARNIGIRYIHQQALKELEKGSDLWNKYFIATLYGPKSIEELWIGPLIARKGH
jgi:transposase